MLFRGYPWVEFVPNLRSTRLNRVEEVLTYRRPAGSWIRAVGFALETRSVRSKLSTMKNPAEIVDFRQKFPRSGWDLIGSGEISLDLVTFPPDLAEISLDSVISPQIQHKSHKNLRYFDQKLAGKFLFHWILVWIWLSQLRQVLEERTRQLTSWSQFLGFVTRRQPARALETVEGGSVLVGSSRLG